MSLSTAETLSPPEAASPEGEVTSEKLLRAYQTENNAAAFSEIVRRHLPAVHAICRRVTSNNHDAEDATQVAFLNLAMQSRAGIEINSVSAWLAQVAHRASLDLIRTHSRRRRRESQSETRAPANGVESPSISVSDKEVSSLLRDEISKLPAKYRLPLILHYFGQMDVDEVSRELGCTRNALTVRLHRGRKLLSAQLQQKGATILSGAVGLMIIDAILTSFCNGMKSEAAHAIAQLTARAGSKTTATLMASRIMAVVQACSLATRAARIKVACVALMFVSVTLANAPTLRESRIAPLNPQVIINSVLHRLSNSMNSLQRAFRTAIQSPQISSTTPAPQTPTAVDPQPIAVASPLQNIVIPNPLAIPFLQSWPTDSIQKRSIAPMPTALPLPPSTARFVPLADLPSPVPNSKPSHPQLGFMVASTGPITLTGRPQTHALETLAGPTNLASLGSVTDPLAPTAPTDPFGSIDVPTNNPPFNDLPQPMGPQLPSTNPIPIPVDNAIPQVPEPATGLLALAAAFLTLGHRRRKV